MSTNPTVPLRSPLSTRSAGVVFVACPSWWLSGSPLLPRKGELLAEYVVQEKLGEGGMGVVLKAWDPDLKRPIAIKLLRPETYSQGDAGRKRLIREAQAMARICHENVVTIYHIGTFTGRVFIAMEFVDGGTLRTWVDADKPSIDAIIQRWTSAGQGLVAAHAEGLVHRDFKPDNVLVTANGRVLVTDFGLVTISTSLDSHDSQCDDVELSLCRTEHGLIMGTPVYMAPEQHEGLSVDARVDQFSFCVSLYEALYGERPFPEVSYPLMVRAILRGEFLPEPNDTAVPKKVRSLLLRGLSANPADRFASMQDLLDELVGRKLAELPTATQPIHMDRVSQLCILERSGRLQQALAMSEELSENIVNTPDALTKAQYHLCCGRIHGGFKNYELATSSFQSSVSAAVEAEVPEIEAEAFSRMVSVLAWQKRLSEAEMMTLAAKSASRRADSPEQRARFEIALSILDYQSERTQEAIGRLQQVLQLWRTELRDSISARDIPIYSHFFLSTLKDEDTFQDKIGHEREALRLASEMGEYQSRWLAGAHCNIARSLYNLDNSKALEHHRKALALYQRTFGEWHEDVAMVLGNMGSTMVEMGTLEEGLSMIKRGLAMSEQILGEDAGEVATLLSQLGMAMLAAQIAGAEYCLLRCLEIREQLTNTADMGIAEAHRWLGMILIGKGLGIAGYAHSERAAAIYEDLGASDSQSGAVSMMAWVCKSYGNKPLALEHAEQSVRMSPKNYHSISVYAQILHDSEPEQAHELLEQSIQLARAAGDPGFVRSMEQWLRTN